VTSGAVLVTGSAGHLGEALVRTLRHDGRAVIGLDLRPSAYTTVIGSVTDRDTVRRALASAEAVVHAATLHTPHLATHRWQDFVDTNVTGTLVVLEEAAAAGVSRFVLASTTSTFGRALVPARGAPAVWIDEDVVPVPRTVYGVTKTTAEGLCQLAHLEHGLPVVVLRLSRFFPEPDDDPRRPAGRGDDNVKVNELLYRRVDLADAVSATLQALERAPAIGSATYVVSATTPFSPADTAALVTDAPSVVRRLFPDHEVVYDAVGWTMCESIGRVYSNARARAELDWEPRYDFRHALDCLIAGTDHRSALARAVGAKPYHQPPARD